MRKGLFLALALAIAMTSCDMGSKKENALKAQNDSLLLEISNRNEQVDGIMGAFNEIQEGFNDINQAESRVNKANLENPSAAENIKENIRFISERLKENREKIAKLEQQLKSSNINSAQLKKAMQGLVAQLEAKQKEIETLQAELASKNIRIAELDDAVLNLSEDKANLEASNAQKEATMAAQEAELNTAWFVFGTKKELKEQRILDAGDVLKNQNFNKEYFTKVDVRKLDEVRLYSKRAELLTNHPAGSYEYTKDDKGQLTLKIKNAKEFWSVSRYLVIQVK